MRRELQRQEDVFLKNEDEIERLARAVEACTTDEAKEVGAGFETIPQGCLLHLSFDASLQGETIQRRRKAVAEIVRQLTKTTDFLCVFELATRCFL